MIAENQPFRPDYSCYRCGGLIDTFWGEGSVSKTAVASGPGACVENTGHNPFQSPSRKPEALRSVRASAGRKPGRTAEEDAREPSERQNLSMWPKLRERSGTKNLDQRRAKQDGPMLCAATAYRGMISKYVQPRLGRTCLRDLTRQKAAATVLGHGG